MQIYLLFKEKGIDKKGKIYLIKGDLKNLSDIEKVFKLSSKLQKNLEAIIHFSGQKSVYDSVINLLNHLDNNLMEQ